MKVQPISDPFFAGPALLLVEDERTRAVLTECWFHDASAKKIVVRAAGGRVGVEGLVRASREHGRKHVYGLVDRDFGSASGAGPVFHTAWHELENHLLDFATLAALHEHADAAQLQARAEARARSLAAWMAVRRTLHETKTALLLTPEDPEPTAVTDLASAQAWFGARTYPEDIERAIRQTWTRAYLKDNRLPQHLLDCEAELTSGAWMQTFSGKEVFEHMTTHGGWRHKTNDPGAVALLLARRWARSGTLPGSMAFLNPVRDAIVRECGL